MHNMEKSLMIIKPDIIWQDEQMQILIHEISPFILVESLEVRRLTEDEVSELYAEHKGKAYYNDLIGHMLSDKVVIIVTKDVNAVSRCRELVRSIRIKYAHHEIKHQNCIHGSDTVKAAYREIYLINRGNINDKLESKSLWEGKRILSLLNNYRSDDSINCRPDIMEEMQNLLG